MRTVSAALTAAALVQSGICAPFHASHATRNDAKSAEALLQKYIIEVDSAQALDTLVSHLDSVNNTQINRSLKSSVFTGVSVTGDSATIDAAAASVSGVVNVWPSLRVNLTSGTSTLESENIVKRDVSSYSPHNITGVDKLHSQGLTGKGAVVAVIDTGIYYKHPALGGGFGKGYKVAGGYDFAGNDEWPISGSRVPDSDPLDEIGHGTYVAGVIAGKSNSFTGVAPDATLLAYKVFSQVDQTEDDILIEAFLQAVNDNADIITSSIAGLSGWPSNALATVVDRIVSQGVFVSFASGNLGSSGAFYGPQGGSAQNSITVASVQPAQKPVLSFTATTTSKSGNTTSSFAYIPGTRGFFSSATEQPVYALGNNATSAADLACNSATIPSGLAGKIVLIGASTVCSWGAQSYNLNQAGVLHTLYYNDAMTAAPSTIYTSMQVALISEADGATLLASLAAGDAVTASFDPSSTQYVGIANAGGGKPSTFSSWGASYDLSLKPDIAAPGEDILTTSMPNGWATVSGTSLATPYIAGIAALYVEKFGGQAKLGPSFGKDLAARFIASGRAVPYSDGSGTDYGLWASPAQVGTGLVDAVAVLEAATTVDFTSARMALNDTAHFAAEHDIVLSNAGTDEVTYEFVSQPAAGVETWKTGSGNGLPAVKQFSEMTPAAMDVTISLPANGTVSLAAGETKTVKVSFEKPTGLTAASIPVYGGKILISGSNGDLLSVPYLGAGADLKTDITEVWHTGRGYPFGVSTNQWTPLSVKPYVTFDLSPSKQDFLRVSAMTTYGSKTIRWDIYESGWTESKWSYPPTVGKNGYIGSVSIWAPGLSGGVSTFNPATDDAADVLTFPLSDWYRENNYQLLWLGALNNGSQIAPGNYSMRLAALRPFGSEAISEDWHVWSQTTIEVRKKSS
ncbi:hypothetical protein TD95_001094 [Thielaviopsis punctulata]|uniref:Peptidase S8/S53 domain-containing protein n=1 Tax=Thielaviopsis punctulata TaxID=72032 RepID=A0A0F4ZIX2_9PEZI|nr:hypothetical protein TD95_001094 [Thielaviopsis punctulata]